MAELLDGKGRILPGFERDKCLVTPGTQTRLTLKWGDRFLPEYTKGPIRLRLLFRDTRLYSVTH